MRRVVVTGLGAITPLGVGVRPTWRRLIAGDSGVVSAAHLEPQSKWRALQSPIAGLVPTTSTNQTSITQDGQKSTWNPSDWLDAADRRRMSKFTQYAVAAAEMALVDAGWKPEMQSDLEATGVCLGSGIGNLDDFYATSVAYEQDVRVQRP